MGLLTRVLVTCFVVLSGATICAAQASPPPPAPAGPTGTAGADKIRRFQNRVVVETEFRRDGMWIKFSYEVPNGQYNKLNEVEIHFLSFSKGFKYKDHRRVVVTLNAKPLLEGEARPILAHCNNGKDSGPCYEFLVSPPLPYADFLRLLKSQKVSITLGAGTWELKPEEIEGLHDLDRSVEKERLSNNGMHPTAPF